MFQYAVNYTKKYLIDSLVCKIRLLKILSNTTSNKMAEKVKLIEKIGKTSISKPVLDFLGVTMSDYKILTTIPATIPAEKENPEENGPVKKDEPKPITASLVLSSRVKPLEELPPIATPEKSSDDSKPTSMPLCSRYPAARSASSSRVAIEEMPESRVFMTSF